MTKRMLIDATHAEETRVVVLDGNRLEDFDVETAAKKQLKGNIYLAKVVRVEPSLQAAFVEYGGGRHGFLAFSEIHPDYYQIPVADRQRLLEMQEEEARAEEEAEDAAAEAAEAAGEEAHYVVEVGHEPPDTDMGAEPDLPAAERSEPEQATLALAIDRDFIAARDDAAEAEIGVDAAPEIAEPADAPEQGAVVAEEIDAPAAVETAPDTGHESEPVAASEDQATEPAIAREGAEESLSSEQQEAVTHEALANGHAGPSAVETMPPMPPPEMLGGNEQEHEHGSEHAQDEADNGHDRREARAPARFLRSYKIQEVIRRRQILLVQVVKEERGTKGAALTTYLSLAGRFSVLMPNSPRGGGISRKITSSADRRRLKEIMAEMQIPRGMGLIVRTAGAARPKAEIRRDCEYLLELWDSIRETTMKSVAPALIHEEASLIKRSIRDNYSRDIEEVLVDGDTGWRAARDFMRMLMPAHARKVIKWHEAQPLFAKHGVEAQLDAMMQPVVQLRSGGYLVINQTEALVAIDVNSGRSTRERGIEETALKTNLEAADEVARQLRLRDLAGLIVVDFIDMESRRNNAAVEKRIKDALKDDRARIQIGSISHFGLLELSRQRLRPSLAETNFAPCPHCGGTGHIRTTETAALAVLRSVEEEGAKRRSAAIVVHVASAVALYILNHKRARLAEIEARYGMSVSFAADESLLPPNTRIERVRPQTEPAPLPVAAAAPAPSEEDEDLAEDEEAEEEEDAEEAAAANGGEDGDARRRRGRRRRRRGGRRDDAPPAETTDPAVAEQPDIDAIAEPLAAAEAGDPAQPGEQSDEEPAPEIAAEAGEGRPRRGRRGGRRRRREPGSEAPAPESAEAEQPASFDAVSSPVYRGPTPADPFGGASFDIFDILDEPEFPPQAAAEPQSVAVSAPPEPEAQPEPALPEDVPASAPHEAAQPVEAEPKFVEAEPQPIQAEPHPIEAEPPLMNGHAPPVAEEEPALPGAAEPTSTPLPPPTLVGSIPVTEKKRGWWRR